jgi:hypothetical protein
VFTFVHTVQTAHSRQQGQTPVIVPFAQPFTYFRLCSSPLI